MKSNIIFHDIQQNTEEWEVLRWGKVGGSGIAKIMANGDKFGDPAKRMAVNIANFELTGNYVPESDFKSSDMNRGHEEEPLTCLLYEEENFVEVTNGGFVENPSISRFAAVSPDGFTGGTGVNEFKSVIPTTMFEFKRLLTNKYTWQCDYNLMVCERDWLDYSVACHAFPIGKQLITIRVLPDMERFSMMARKLRMFEELVDINKELIMR